jgi:hypothetical protein
MYKREMNWFDHSLICFVPLKETVAKVLKIIIVFYVLKVFGKIK